MKYIVLIPALNEQETIAQVVASAREFMPEADVLVIDDGSTDATAQRAEGAGAKLLSMPYNLGYGAALQTGFRFAADKGYGFVIMMDADGQHDASCMQDLIATMDRDGADVVIGSRFITGGYRSGFLRRAGTWMFALIARLYTGVTFTDPTSGFQLLNRNAFTYLSEYNNYPLDYPDVNIIMALHKKQFKVVEAPVRMIEKQGKSMHSGLKPFLYVVRMFLSIIIVVLRKEH